ncbi:MAG: RNA polymerase-binding protein DksA [Acidovorax sp.]|nr:RNA polymerase-binding protein DksA [Acidovorax sp.]
MTAETSKKKAATKVAAPAAKKTAAVKSSAKASATKAVEQTTASSSSSPARSPAGSASIPPLSAAPTASAQPITDTKAMSSTISVPAALKRDPKLANNWKSKTAEELSDAEVIAMPDDEYMNDKQMAFFRHKLMKLKQDMHNNAGETAENLREDTVVVPDPADRATIEEEHALELRTRDRERKLLKKIEQSIARIDAGDYGYCDETGEPIGVGRLLARPTATLSLEAQQRRELKQKMFGD